MNSSSDTQRNKTLIVVEGDYEKNNFLNAVLQCFPEIPVSYENIYIYGTKIYDLYQDIEKQYGEDWYEVEGMEINIPYIISKKKNQRFPKIFC